VLEAIDTGLEPFKHLLKREVTEEDLIRLTEIKIKRISKYNKFKADEYIRGLENDIAEAEKNLRNLTRFTIRWFENLKKKYGPGRERRTEIAPDGFGKLDRKQVAAPTETLYLDRKNGFAGWGLKKEDAIGKCSRLDDIIAFSQDGKMRVVRVAEKVHVGHRPVHVAVFHKDEEKIYSMIYRDGRDGPVYAKRFRVGGVTRDKEYELARGRPGTRVLYFAVHSSEEESNDQMVTVHLRPALRLRNLARPFLFGEISVKGRGSKGNIVTKHAVDRVVRAPKDTSETGGDQEG
jgi:topoisomerase-4 subunit A